MKVFISWSGERSCELADAIKTTLTEISPHLPVFCSNTDLLSGAKWLAKLTEELEASSFGIFCMLPESLGSTWMCFEAGVISNVVGESHICPLFFDGLKESDLSYPLAQFQGKVFEEEKMWQLVRDINAVTEEDRRIQESWLKRQFDRTWPELAGTVAGILAKPRDQDSDPKRPAEELLNEIVTGQRELQRQFTRLMSGWSVVASGDVLGMSAPSGQLGQPIGRPSRITLKTPPPKAKSPPPKARPAAKTKGRPSVVPDRTPKDKASMSEPKATTDDKE